MSALAWREDEKGCAPMGVVIQQGVLWYLGKCGLGKTVSALFCAGACSGP